jgi:CHRD domain/Secretion system C-terminal sorting domain
MKKITFIFTLLFALLGKSAFAFTFRENLLFTAKMDGAQMVPSVSTTAQGIGSFMLNKRRDSIAINLSIIGATPTSIAIYQGKEGQNGTLLFDLTSAIQGKSLATFLRGTSVTGNLTQLFSEDLYVLVSTADYPSGLMRSQIKLVTDRHFMADLKGSEVVPAVTTAAYGLGSFGLSLDQGKLNLKVICQNLSGAIIGAKLYSGAIGAVGTEAVNLSSFVDGNVVTASLVPTAALLNDLFAAEIYLNIETAAHPNGEIRSQLRLLKGLTFEARSDGAQMVPPIANEGQSISIIRLSPRLDTLFYDVVLDKIITNIDYAHLHVGDYGEPYGALQVDLSNSIVGRRIKGIKRGSELNSVTINKLLVSNLAVVAHTTAHPDGEIRGQAVRFAHEGYTLDLSGGAQVPFNASGAYGSGFVTINRDGDQVYYDWLVGDLSGEATSAHFHSGVAGQNGPVIYDMSSIMQTSGTSAAASGFWKSTDTPPFLPTNLLQFDNKSVYLNIHTDAFPDGEIRGQVQKGTVFYSTSATNDLAEQYNIQISPNPAQSVIQLNLSSQRTGKLSIQIVNTLGQVVYSENTTNRTGDFQSTIDVSGWSNGVYFLNINDGQGMVSRKIVKW